MKQLTNNEEVKVDDESENQSTALDKISSLEIEELITKLSKDAKSKIVQQTKYLRKLFSILESQHGKNIILRKSVIVSLCLVFKDILPTYKLKPLTGVQKNQKMKKDTFKLYSEEEALLAHYERYVKLLKAILIEKYDIKKMKHIHWTDTDKMTILKCACSMIQNNPDYNFVQILLESVIPFLNSSNLKEVKITHDAISELLSSDIHGDISLKICQTIKQYCIKSKFEIKGSVLKPILILEMEDAFEEEVKKIKIDRNAFSRNMKKQHKKSKKRNEKLADVSAKESKETKIKNNSLIIRNIFYIYFKILKKNKLNSTLLTVVLESICCFGRLIESKLIPEIFRILGGLSENKNVSINNRLKSMHVLITILSAGRAMDILDIDAGAYCSKLINLIKTTNIDAIGVQIVITCTTKLLIKRKGRISMTDVENLVKMLIKLAYDQKNIKYISSYILINIVKYLRIYPKLKMMLDVCDDEILPDIGFSKSNECTNEYMKNLNELCKLSCYEIAGVAKRIKKYFSFNDTEDDMLQLKSSLESLTKLSNDKLLETLKNDLQEAKKRKPEHDTLKLMECKK